LLNLGLGTEELCAQRLLHLFDLRLVCITYGSRGSLLVTEGETVAHKGFRVTVADAVGAGDAFTACLGHHYLRGHSLQDISDSANRLASWVATQKGATPPISSDRLHSILNGVALR
jgi:fructokinase